MTIKASEIARRLGFVRQADETEEPTQHQLAPAPTEAPDSGGVGDPGTKAPMQPPPIQSGTGPEAVPMDQIEQLRQVLTEMVGDEDEEAFEPSYTPARKSPESPKAPLAEAPTEPGANVFRHKEPSDEYWLPSASRQPDSKTKNERPKGTDVAPPDQSEIWFSNFPKG